MFSRVAASHTTFLLPQQDPLFTPLGFYPCEHHCSRSESSSR